MVTIPYNDRYSSDFFSRDRHVFYLLLVEAGELGNSESGLKQPINAKFFLKGVGDRKETVGFFD